MQVRLRHQSINNTIKSRNFLGYQDLIIQLALMTRWGTVVNFKSQFFPPTLCVYTLQEGNPGMD